MPLPTALLLGKIVHARKEWESLSEVAELKVCFSSLCLTCRRGFWLSSRLGSHFWYKGVYDPGFQRWEIR